MDQELLYQIRSPMTKKSLAKAWIEMNNTSSSYIIFSIVLLPVVIIASLSPFIHTCMGQNYSLSWSQIARLHFSIGQASAIRFRGGGSSGRNESGWSLCQLNVLQLSLFHCDWTMNEKIMNVFGQLWMDCYLFGGRAEFWRSLFFLNTTVMIALLLRIRIRYC